MKPRIAVIMFPGTNCEDETVRMVRAVGMDGEILRWNTDYQKLRDYDGYIIAGGFSYEDRGRSGLIASFDPVMDILREEARRGKVLLGVCNGAQVLVESGLVPGVDNEKLSMCLAWNKRVKDGKVMGEFISRWVYVKMAAPRGRSAFNDFPEDTVLAIPAAHGEGRFTTQEKELLDRLKANNQTVFRYCDSEGNFTEEYPLVPNGAMFGLAGICNEAGNVMAIMPHPERTIEGAGKHYMTQIFTSMKSWIEKHPVMKEAPKVVRGTCEYAFSPVPKVQLSLLVRLIITDNEEWTIGETLKSAGFPHVKLRKQLWWGIETDAADLDVVAKKLIATQELANLSKEHVEVVVGSKSLSHESFLVQNLEDMKGKSKADLFKAHFPQFKIKNIHRGILWTLEGVKDEAEAKRVADTFLLHNPHSMTIAKL